MVRLKPGSRIHLMGICGTAMASLAGLLKERGFRITGSDQNVYPPMSTFLTELGIDIMEGYRASNLDSRPDFVVVGNVISKHHEEATALLKSGIPYASFPETLRDRVIEDRHSVVVAGTHGKTTTTSMMAWICEQEGLKPGFLVGGLPKNFSRSFQDPGGDYFVVEGDEYDTAFFAKVPKFCFYKPRSVILTGVEFDHADIYDCLEDVVRAFSSLLKLIPEHGGCLVYNAEDKQIKKILHLYKGPQISYGLREGDWTADSIEHLNHGLSFDVLYKSKRVERLFVPMFGSYNVLNSLSVYALSQHLGFQSDMKSVFADFKGVRRRQEIIGEPGGIQVIEDFAHHPTAVRATIESFQKRKGKDDGNENEKSHGKLFVIFEPRSNTSRRNIFQNEYLEALKLSDHLLISEPFGELSPACESLNVQAIVSEVSRTKPAHSFRRVEEAVRIVKDQARAGDRVLIMSNGGFQDIYKKILKTLGNLHFP